MRIRLMHTLEIKNPIQLARQVLDQSNRELTLRRVPPNLLVGQGATDFAFDQGMLVVPHDALISPAARERWNRWKADLRSAERRAKRDAPNTTTPRYPSASQLPPYEATPLQERQPPEPKSMRNSVWNEGEPISPPSSVAGFRGSSGKTLAAILLAKCGLTMGIAGHASLRSRNSSVDSQTPGSTVPGTPGSEAEDVHRRSSIPLTADSLAANAIVANVRLTPNVQDAARDPTDSTPSDRDDSTGDSGDIDDGDVEIEQFDTALRADGHGEDKAMVDDTDSSGSVPLPSATPSPPATPKDRRLSEDMITDTVGAIAIDNEGNIACGASSGGIGMKFRGRVGPAALVGVGAAVCPANNDDKSRMTTACVTSGTGEHMATTLAANVCAERLYNSVRARKTGGLEPCSDDEAVKAMIEQDFMSIL